MFGERIKKMIAAAVAFAAFAVVLSGCSAADVASGILRGMTKPSATSQPVDDSGSVKYNLYVVNCNQSISLRSEPSTSAPEIMQLALGVQVGYIDSAENGFYKVSVDGTVGYALASYLSGSPQAVSDTVQYYMYVYNCNESITLRSAPSSSSASMGQIPYGTAVGIIGDGGIGFYKVKYNGLIGYASSAYLSASVPSQKVTSSVSAAEVEDFVDSSLKAFVNGINTGDTTYISWYFTGDEAVQERKTHDKIVQSVLSEEIISLNCHSGKIISSNKATAIRDSVIRVVYDDGSVKDIKESYLYTVQISDDGSMRIIDLEER